MFHDYVCPHGIFADFCQKQTFGCGIVSFFRKSPAGLYLTSELKVVWFFVYFCFVFLFLFFGGFFGGVVG